MRAEKRRHTFGLSWSSRYQIVPKAFIGKYNEIKPPVLEQHKGWPQQNSNQMASVMFIYRYHLSSYLNKRSALGQKLQNLLISCCSLVSHAGIVVGFIVVGQSRTGGCTQKDNKDLRNMTWWDVTLKTENGTIKTKMLHSKSGEKKQREAEVNKWYDDWQNNQDKI